MSRPTTTSSSSPEVLLKNRFLGYLIWQSIPSSLIFLLFKPFLSSPPSSSSSFWPLFSSFFSFLTFLLSLLLFSSTLSLIASPHPRRPAPFLDLAIRLLRFLFVPSSASGAPDADDFRARAKVTLGFVLFAAASAASGLAAAVSLCGVGAIGDGFWVVGRVGLRGFFVGLLFGLHYVFKRRWVLEFPIIQRPPYFSFKMGVPSAARRALKLSIVASIFSAILLELLPHPFKYSFAIRRFFTEQIVFSTASFAIFFCWELTHHLHRVLHTKRSIFAPPKGSAAAETNPSEHLLLALEESNPTSLLRYLAYLDLCMVCENNVDTWRRAAFFEETGETYKRVIAVCLKPLEQLASRLGEGLGNSVDKPAQLANQLSSPTDARFDSNCIEQLHNFQLYAWCSRTAASLTACSHKEDKFGVAQLSGSNAAVISTLISCLLAVENFMGKKTNLQSPNQLLGPAGIRWATANSGRVDVAASKRRTGPVNSKAYAVADVLKISIYQIVSAFHDEMLAGAKGSLLEKNWISGGKPHFGTREVKKVLSGETGLGADEQRLVYRGKERENGEYLDTCGVKDRSKVVLIQDPSSIERRFIQMRRNAEIQSANRAINDVTLQLNQLSHQVSAIEKSISEGVKVPQVQITTLIEMLMRQAIKLETIPAEGDHASAHKHLQGKRVQKCVETLDVLKVSNARIKAVVVTTKWETFI